MQNKIDEDIIERKEEIAMAHTEALTLHIDTELKERAANLFQELGLDLSTATGLFYRQALRRRGLPFDVRLRKRVRNCTVLLTVSRN